MKILKKVLTFTVAVFVLTGSLGLTASAACAHEKWVEYPTNQFSSSHHTHTVIVGYYTSGKPITVDCSVSKKKEKFVVHCKACGAYLYAYDRYISESHSVVHN